MKTIINKKILTIFIALLSLLPLSKTEASTLSCSQVDGMAIFGYKYDEYIFIGAIGNEYNSKSIANEYGAGNEYSSNSIFNEYGSFGSEYSSYSAFNEYASKPPIIVDDNYKFVGYLTTGYKTPSINTYEAVACAKKSYSSPNSDMEDITFKDIPKSNYSGYSGSGSASLPSTSCPSNATYTSSGCVCNSGYITDPTKTYCVAEPKPQPTCPFNSSLGADNQCYCNSGFTNQNNACIPIVDWCKNTYGPNTYVKEGKCECLEGNYYNEITKKCSVVEKTETVIQKEISPKVANTQTITTKKTDSKSMVVKQEVKKDIIEDKNQESKPEIEKPAETPKKVKWYQKIFNWFKKK